MSKLNVGDRVIVSERIQKEWYMDWNLANKEGIVTQADRTNSNWLWINIEGVRVCLPVSLLTKLEN